MADRYDFDYYYGIESEQFSFYRVPRQLIKDAHFKNLSSDAKLLYGLMLDRMALSMRNGWYDEENRVYIYYTIEDIMEDLGCARATGVKILAELDSKKGIGLIEKKRQGLGKPDIIYVKNFIAMGQGKSGEVTEKEAVDTDVSTEVQKLNFKSFKKQTSESSNTELQEFQNLVFCNSKNHASGSSESESLGVQKLNAKYNNNNYTEMNHNHPIHLSQKELIDKEATENAYKEIIAENIEYEEQMKILSPPDAELYGEMYEMICDVVNGERETLTVGGSVYSADYVKVRFLKLRSANLLYILECLSHTVTKVGNIRSYLMTALFNSVSTMNHFYSQEVRHDMYGGGWIEQGMI